MQEVEGFTFTVRLSNQASIQYALHSSYKRGSLRVTIPILMWAVSVQVADNYGYRMRVPVDSGVDTVCHALKR